MRHRCAGCWGLYEGHPPCPYCGSKKRTYSYRALDPGLVMGGKPLALPRMPRGMVGHQELNFTGDPARWMSRRLVNTAKRGHWRCHICGLPVPRKVSEKHPAAPTRDHVIPRSVERMLVNNVRLAHRWCNTARGHRPVESLDRREFRNSMAALVPELLRA